MRMFTKVMTGMLLSTSMAALWSCGPDLECGKGTVEINGECTAGGTQPTGQCGAGSRWDPSSNQCITDFCEGENCGICGPNTQLQPNDAGVPVCVGTGGVSLPCDQELPSCPTPGSGRFTICGRLVDTETGTNLTNATFDPRTLSISFYEALAFASDPNVQPEFTVTPDECGRYVSADVSHQGVLVPSPPFLAVGVDDASGDNVVLTGIGIEGAAGGKALKVRTYATRNSTATKWGNSAVSMGAYLAIFLDTAHPPDPLLNSIYPGTPVSGVTITRGGSPLMANDLYFSDTDAFLRTTINTGLTATGANGSGLFLNSGLNDFSGTDSKGCTWPTAPAATLPNAVFVSEKLGTCP